MLSRTRSAVTVATIAVATLATIDAIPERLLAEQGSSASIRLSPQDTSLNINATSYSGDTLLATYTWPDNRVANAILMKFDLAGIPAGAVVENATLRLALVAADATPDLTYVMTVHKVVSRNPNPATATGYTSDGVTGWTPNACCYNNVPLAQADISLGYDMQWVDKVPGYKSWNVTAMVQEWQANPATNFGLLLNSDPSTLRDRYRYFASMEHPTVSLRPFLEVTYSAADTTPPSVAITAPASGTTVSGTVTVAANATDNAGVAGVQFRIDGAPLGAERTASPYTIEWDTTTASDGTHTLTAVARDGAGNTTTSAGVSVTVANGSVRLSPQDTSLNINATNYSGDTRLTTYTWPDNRIANAILMKFDLAPIPAGAVVHDAILHLALVESDSLPDATYTVTAHKVVGRNPNPSTATGHTADGATGWTPNACCHNNVPLAQADISLAYDTRPIDKTPGDKSWTITTMVQEWRADPATNFGLLLNSDPSRLRDRYRYFASMEHPDANLRPFLHVTYSMPAGDTTPPSVAISSPAAGATVSNTVTVAAAASDNVGVAGVQFKLDGTNLGAEDTTSPYSVSWNTTTAANGSHTLTAVARDAAGNVGTSAAVNVTVANDTTPPSVAISSPAAGATVASTVTVAATASDNVGVAGVQFKLDGTNLGAEDTASPYSVSWNTSTAANGSHTLTAVARDAAGNTKTSAGVTVTVSNGSASSGIAALYPGDVGIENHPDVIFVEKFEEATQTELFSRWTDVRNGSSMSFSSNVPPGSSGSRSLNIPWVGGGVSDGGHLFKQLNPGVDDTLYVRFYIRYPTSGAYDHTGIWVGGSNPPLSWPNPQAGTKPAGNDRFIAAAEQNSQTSRFDHYNYWMNMRQSADGKFWGNHLLNNPNVDANLGQWTCVEQMVKLNNPTTEFNGEHAIWLDGVKVSHLGKGFPNGSWSGGIFTQNPNGSPFEGFRWRSDSNLKLNWIWLQNYSPDDPAGFSGSMYFDHVVVAKKYIGCLASGSPPPPSGDTTPPTVSLSAPVAGATVSGSAVTVSATASDDVGVAGVQFELDGANLGAEDTTSPYSISWNTTSASNGSHTLTAVARDAAGNQTTSAARTVTVANGSPGGAVIFESNWDRATGTSTSAVTDGGRWPNYWEFNNGTSVQLLSVVSGGPNGHNALRVQQRGSTYAANLQIDNFMPQSSDFYLRYYMKNDDTSGAGDHIVTVDTYQYSNLTFMRKYGGASSWRFVMSLYGCGFTYPIGHWGPSRTLSNGQWYRFEYHVDYINNNHVQVHPRVYDAAGTLILSDADFLQEDFGAASWNGRSDWTLASYYSAGHTFCVNPGWMNDFGLGNNGQQGAADTGRYWYFSGVQIRSDRWPGPVQ